MDCAGARDRLRIRTCQEYSRFNDARATKKKLENEHQARPCTDDRNRALIPPIFRKIPCRSYSDIFDKYTVDKTGLSKIYHYPPVHEIIYIPASKHCFGKSQTERCLSLRREEGWTYFLTSVPLSSSRNGEWNRNRFEIESKSTRETGKSKIHSGDCFVFMSWEARITVNIIYIDHNDRSLPRHSKTINALRLFLGSVQEEYLKRLSRSRRDSRWWATLAATTWSLLHVAATHPLRM